MRSHRSSQRAALAWLALILDNVIFWAAPEDMAHAGGIEACFMSPHGSEHHVLCLASCPCALEVTWSHFSFPCKLLALLWKTDLFGINSSCQFWEPPVTLLCGRVISDWSRGHHCAVSCQLGADIARSKTCLCSLDSLALQPLPVSSLTYLRSSFHWQPGNTDIMPFRLKLFLNLIFNTFLKVRRKRRKGRRKWILAASTMGQPGAILCINNLCIPTRYLRNGQYNIIFQIRKWRLRGIK